jgi:hypothetical protein
MRRKGRTNPVANQAQALCGYEQVEYAGKSVTGISGLNSVEQINKGIGTA